MPGTDQPNDYPLVHWHGEPVNDPIKTDDEIVALLHEALAGLVDRLDEIHADPAYKSVWTIHQIHVGPYCGPTYVEALKRARAALRVARRPKPLQAGPPT